MTDNLDSAVQMLFKMVNDRMDKHEASDAQQFANINQTLTAVQLDAARSATASEVTAKESQKHTQQNRWLIGICLGFIPAVILLVHNWH